VSPRRIAKLGAFIKPATLFKFHKALVCRKYRRLFTSSSSPRRSPGPKGPSAELIAAIVEMKRRNPKFGCVRIAQQIAHAFGVDIDKDVARRVLAKHYRPGDSGANGPFYEGVCQAPLNSDVQWFSEVSPSDTVVVTSLSMIRL
jgi:putative transposase